MHTHILHKHIHENWLQVSIRILVKSFSISFPFVSPTPTIKCWRFRLKILWCEFHGGLLFSDVKVQIGSPGLIWWLYDVGGLGFFNHVALPFLAGSFYLMVQMAALGFTVMFTFQATGPSERENKEPCTFSFRLSP